MRLLATLPSLDYLARGGRVPGAAAWGARWLGLNPVFEFRKRKVKPLRPTAGSRLARRRIVDIWARDVDQERQRGRPLHVAALHAVEPAVAEELLAEVRRRCEPATAFVGSFSPVMVAHTGPGLVGLAWWWDEPNSEPHPPYGGSTSGNRALPGPVQPEKAGRPGSGRAGSGCTGPGRVGIGRTELAVDLGAGRPRRAAWSAGLTRPGRGPAPHCDGAGHAGTTTTTARSPPA